MKDLVPGKSKSALKKNAARLLVETHLNSLVEKAEHFFVGDYKPPTTAELKALRKELSLTKVDAAAAVGISIRTWSTREAGNGASGMPEDEFSMVVLFLLRSTNYWKQIDKECFESIKNNKLLLIKNRVNTNLSSMEERAHD